MRRVSVIWGHGKEARRASCAMGRCHRTYFKLLVVSSLPMTSHSRVWFLVKRHTPEDEPIPEISAAGPRQVETGKARWTWSLEISCLKCTAPKCIHQHDIS